MTPPCFVPAPAGLLWERAQAEAFIDLARAILGVPSDIKMEQTCAAGHDHSTWWFEPDARVFVPPNPN